MVFGSLMKFFSGGARIDATGPEGRRAYVIGDVHGRFDLLKELIGTIEADIARRPYADNVVVMLGDLIDRGPQSCEVVDYLLKAEPEAFRFEFLAGNHEEIFLQTFDGSARTLRHWLHFGGRECLHSYGIEDLWRAESSPDALLDEMARKIPHAHIAFIRSFADTFRFGDYLCVHAGVRPGVPLEEQAVRDLRWIREDFMDSRADHGFVAVHGHTIVDRPDERRNRIGIDTGAYQTGRLTALVIEGAERRYLVTGDDAAA